MCFEFFGDETFRDISHNREKENRETERKRDFDFLKKYLFCVVAIGVVCVQYY